MLTFRTTWALNGEYAMGSWKGNTTRLHTVVYKHYNPDYVPGREAQVDHIIPEEKLDNRKCNLRVATNSQQARNKVKRKGCTSKYIGVYYDKKGNRYCGEIAVGDKKYRFRASTENEVARLVNAKRTELFGDRVTLINIIE
jgi:hypothetical protein